MKKLNGSYFTPETVNGLTTIGTREYRAFLAEVGLYWGHPVSGFCKEAYCWAKAAEEAYAHDPEEFVLTGRALDGHTREDAMASFLAFCDAEEDENGELVHR